MATEAQRRASAQYDRKNTVGIHLKMNLKTDADILAWLEKIPASEGGKQGYIKRLIRQDMKGV